MASRRRSLEERNLKTLRELAALPANKQCFDCHQRGPTYINMTIGSFVCTSCSGILRGLTPPHRVKSITMTTFTPEEIDFLKSRGNEYCKYVWLGTYDSRTSNVDSDIKDDHRKRDLMSQKYEKKRWYVDPDIAVKKMQHDQQFQPKPTPTPQPVTTTSTIRHYGRVPDVQPISQLLGKTPTTLVVEGHQQSEKWPHPVSSASASTVMTTRNTSQNQGAKSSMDLLSEFAADSYISPSSSSAQGSTANGNFANFDSAFVNSDKSETTPTSSLQFFGNNNRLLHTPPVGWTSFDDDLDPLSPSSTSAGPSPFSTSTVASSRGTQPSSSVMPRPLSLPTFAPTNPFKNFPALNPLPKVSTPTQWPSFPVSSSNASLPASVSLDAYPAFSMAAKEGSLFSPPPPPVPVTTSVNTSKLQQQQPSQSSLEDRYAALADLDIRFHQPTSVTSPTWSVEPTTTTTVVTSAATFARFSASEPATSNVFTVAPSNPFASATGSWVTQPPKIPNAPTVNPFQNMPEAPGLPYQPQPQICQAYAPLPVVGNSPSEDVIRVQYGTNPATSSPFQAFGSNSVSNPPNGYRGGPFFMQNGDFVTSPTGRTTWGMPPPTSMPVAFTTSQLTSVAPPTTDVEKHPNEFSQYSDWTPNPANPFAMGSSVMGSAPKPSPTNPFL